MLGLLVQCAEYIVTLLTLHTRFYMDTHRYVKINIETTSNKSSSAE